MTKTLRASQGLGLAAPQVGENIRLCIIEIENELFVLINPEIKSLSNEKIVAEEGCLSFPGKFMPVERHKRVKVKAIDGNGKAQIIRARGLFARALQHEIDHLNGELFIDKVAEI
jgi:peptide deformylase